MTTRQGAASRGDNNRLTCCFAGTRLEALQTLEEFASVTSIVTIRDSWVHRHCVATGRPVTLTSWIDRESAFSFLATQNVDLVFFAGFPFILPPQVLASGPMFVNSHPSLLPAYAGRDPVRQAFANREPWMGITVHWMTAVVDSGPILCQERIPVEGLELQNIYDLLFGVAEPKAVAIAMTELLRGIRSTAPSGTRFTVPDHATENRLFADIELSASQHRLNGRQVVVVQGLGFVGAAVAAVVAGARSAEGSPLYYVIGVDLGSPASYWKVGSINAGTFPFPTADQELGGLVSTAVRETGNLVATSHDEVYSVADVILVDVQLDISGGTNDSIDDQRINETGFEDAIRAIGRSMRPEALIIVETTVPVGTLETIVLPMLNEERLRRAITEPVLLAHAYERVTPGPNYTRSITRHWRTFSGVDRKSAESARKFLESVVDVASYPLFELATPRESEFAKLLENSYRAANIAFIHEWTLMAEALEIDLFSVVDSIRVRAGTHDNMRYPGFGVGGYCLPKDPLLAQLSLRDFFGSELVLETTLRAVEINRKMPLHTLDLLKSAAGPLAGTSVGVLGLTYLPDVPDTRNSASAVLVDELNSIGARVLVHDPLVRRWDERPDIQVSASLDHMRGLDALIFTVGHSAFTSLSLDELLAMVPPGSIVVDAQNVITDDRAQALHESGRRVLGVGKGHWRKAGYHQTAP